MYKAPKIHVSNQEFCKFAGKRFGIHIDDIAFCWHFTSYMFTSRTTYLNAAELDIKYLHIMILIVSLEKLQGVSKVPYSFQK